MKIYEFLDLIAPWIAICLVGIALVVLLTILKIEQTDARGVARISYT